MQKIFQFCTAIVLIIILSNNSAYSANELFRSQSTGNWNANSTWQMSTNGGTTWFAATSTPSDTSGSIAIQNFTTVTVTANVSADQLTINTGGTLSINAAIVFTLLNGTGTDFTIQSGATVSGAGIFQTQGTATTMNLTGGSNFSVALKVNSGTTTVSDLSSPYNGKLFGSVTVDAGTTLSSNITSSYTLFIYGNLTNNGTITGTGGGNTIRFFGSSLVNNGAIISPVFSFDSTTSVSGSGTYTGAGILIGGNGNVSLLNDVTFSISSKFSINTGGIFNANLRTLTFTSGTFEILSGGLVASSGLIRTQGTVFINPRTGSNFNANLNINTGTTTVAELSSPYAGRLNGGVTVDAGATLSSNITSSYTLFIYNTLTNNGTITGTGGGNTIKFFGSTLVNNGSISSPVFRFDSTTSVSGTGTYTGGDIIVGAQGNVSLTSDVTFSISSIFSIRTGGIFNANLRTLTFTSGTFEILSGGTVASSGLIRTQGSVFINPRSGSNFNANLTINTGTTTVAELSSPYTGRLNGNVTVDAGATLNTHNTSSYTLFIYNNLTNNGTITGSGSRLKLFGSALVNNGSITSPIFSFDSTTSVSGTGTYTGGDIIISGNGNVTFLNSVTFSLNSKFTINTGGILNANLFTITFTSGTFEILSGGTVASSGLIRTQGNVLINPRTGSNFNANLNINSGTTIVSEISSPYTASLFGQIIVDAGATLSSNNTESYTLLIHNNLTNNGTITGIGDVEFQSGVHTLQGTGIWTTTAFILNGATVNLTSNHQFLNVVINTGATFNISSNTVKFTASNPITQNGTFTNTGSKIEYIGTSEQNISAANITYYGLRIINSEGTVLLGNVSVNDTLSVIAGDLDLNGKIITVSSAGYLTETPGNTIKGTTGYITTTRNVGIPSSLNVGGFGAVLTATTNLGNTEIRRGHGVQTGGSIKRYFDITPSNNTGLSATLVFKYDDSELNLRPESILKLLKSTNAGLTFTLMGGTVNTTLNEITLSGITSFSRWTADSTGVSVVINMAIEGFYNPSTNRLRMLDTVRIYLRNTVAPYAIVDSAKSLLDSATLKAAFVFPTLTSGTYYIQTKHRNSIETWSKAGGEVYTVGMTLNYDFTSAASRAFGNNQVQVDGTPLRFAIYSGDILQDGVIDGSDGLIADNDAAIFLAGYVPSDVNGDRFVDGTDAAIVDNNAANFVSVARP
ncbi:MAG: hypothetical protein ABIY50_04830 [Ignavibacteria bacterium]